MRWMGLSLLIGIAIGWYLREVMGESVAIPSTPTASRVLPRLSDAVGQSVDMPDRTEQPVPVRTRAPRAVEKADTASADDLTIIKGIGEVFAQRLAEIGITRFSDLAALNADSLAERLGNISAERIEREGWIDQGRALAKGDTLQ